SLHQHTGVPTDKVIGIGSILTKLDVNDELLRLRGHIPEEITKFESLGISSIRDAVNDVIGKCTKIELVKGGKIPDECVNDDGYSGRFGSQIIGSVAGSGWGHLSHK
ncbi:614_t:CDS:2, partial [Ambispora leptoticha]